MKTKIYLTGKGKITKSINERAILEAQAYNTLQDYAYLKTCPDKIWKQVRVKIMNEVSKYNSLRACFDYYTDKNTLKGDKQIKNIVKCLNVS